MSKFVEKQNITAMTFNDIISHRRSRRRFESRPVEKDKIDAILRAAFKAPSSKNCRSTRLAVVEDRETLAKIADMRSTGSAFVKDAPVAIVVMADPALTDLWVDNCAITATIIQLAAESLGLGSCWVHVNGRLHREHQPEKGAAGEYLHTFLNVPKNYNFLCVIVLGYPSDNPKPHPEQDDSDKVFFI